MERTESRSVFAAVASTIVGIHMIAVTLAAIPTNPVSEALDNQLDYLTPYFGQSWRLFAPNPIDEDRALLVQGAYVGDDGKIQVTPWVNWTKVEQDVIEHRLIGGRAGYITSKFYGALDEEFQEMSSQQEVASGRSSPVAPPSWSQLEAFLAQVGPDEDDLQDYLDYDRAAARLATDVIDAGAGGNYDITAVRYALREQDVTPYENRHGTAAERKAARPPAVVRIGGWRAPTYGPQSETDGVEKFFRRHG